MKKDLLNLKHERKDLIYILLNLKDIGLFSTELFFCEKIAPPLARRGWHREGRLHKARTSKQFGGSLEMVSK